MLCWSTLGQSLKIIFMQSFPYMLMICFCGQTNRTITDKQGMIVAGQAANQNLVPLVFDPVAVGATEYRKQVAQGKPIPSQLVYSTT